MTNGQHAIVPETKVTLKMAWTLASVATTAAVVGSLAWSDVRHQLADLRRENHDLRVNVTKIGEKLGIAVSWPLDENDQ